MRKFNISVFAGFSLGLTLYAMASPGYYTELLISSSGLYLLLRVVIAAFMLAYVFLPQVRTYYSQTLLGTVGAAMLLFGFATFISPTFFGRLTTYIPIVDTLLLIEGGILAMLMSLELPAHRSQLIDKNFEYVASLMAVQPKKLSQGSHPRSSAARTPS